MVKSKFHLFMDPVVHKEPNHQKVYCYHGYHIQKIQFLNVFIDLKLESRCLGNWVSSELHSMVVLKLHRLLLKSKKNKFNLKRKENKGAQLGWHYNIFYT